MGCSGRSFAAEGSRRGIPVKSRVANFSKKKGLYFWAFLTVGRNRLCMDVVAGPRRGKPVKSRVANFSKRKRNSTFGLFWLWEETGYVWDVVAGVLLQRGQEEVYQ